MPLANLTVYELRRLPIEILHRKHQDNKSKQSDVQSSVQFDQELYDFFKEEADIAIEEIQRRERR